MKDRRRKEEEGCTRREVGCLGMLFCSLPSLIMHSDVIRYGDKGGWLFLLFSLLKSLFALMFPKFFKTHSCPLCTKPSNLSCLSPVSVCWCWQCSGRGDNVVPSRGGVELLGQNHHTLQILLLALLLFVLPQTLQTPLFIQLVLRLFMLPPTLQILFLFLFFVLLCLHQSLLSLVLLSIQYIVLHFQTRLFVLPQKLLSAHPRTVP